MQGYDTKQQRDSHLKALGTELRDVKRAISIAQEKLDEVPDGKRVERASREVELENLESRVGDIEEQLKAFKGEAPHKRAAKRSESAGVEKR